VSLKGTPERATIARMEKREIPEATARRFADSAEALAGKGVSVTKMFGMPSLKAAGKLFAGVYGEALTFKLGGKTHAEALALKGAEFFDPSGMGRPMKEWVVVPSAHARRWSGLAEAARTFVAG
jgi:hypothetical protein